MRKIPKDEMCANCGTDLEWWIEQLRARVYRLSSDEYLCSKKCLKEYRDSYEYEIIKKCSREK